jgi:hypothetical protein
MGRCTRRGTKGRRVRNHLCHALQPLQAVDDVFSLMSSINKRLGPLQLDREVLWRTFDRWWEDLKQALDKIGTASPGETRTENKWLLTSDDLTDELKADYNSVWVVTLDIFRRAITQDIRGIINDKVRSGIQIYIFRECRRPQYSGSPETGRFEPGKSSVQVHYARHFRNIRCHRLYPFQQRFRY